MTIDQQQVNVSELQRLNEAILLTMDAIRRVVPQLTQQTQIPMMGTGMGMGMGMGTPTIDPITAQLLQAQLQRHLWTQSMPWQQGFGGFNPWQQQLGYGQHPFAQLFAQHWLTQQHPFAQQLGQQVPFGGQYSFGQVPFAQQGGYGQHPLAQLFAQQPYGGQQVGGQQSPFGQWPQPFGGVGVGFGGINAQRPF